MIPKNLLTIPPNGNSVLMAEKRPLLAILERRPLVDTLFGQRGRGPIVGVMLRLKPEARGPMIKEFAIDTLTWAIGLGAGRILMRLIELNLAEFLGKAAKRGGE